MRHLLIAVLMVPLCMSAQQSSDIPPLEDRINLFQHYHKKQVMNESIAAAGILIGGAAVLIGNNNPKDDSSVSPLVYGGSGAAIVGVLFHLTALDFKWRSNKALAGSIRE